MSGRADLWDLVVVGAGPAGACAALGALREDPAAHVLLLDRADFPRDKACGDGVAPQALDLLASAGVPGLVDDWAPVTRLRLAQRGAGSVARDMARPARVVPRAVLDHRIVAAALGAGADLRRARVRGVTDAGRDAAFRVVESDAGRVHARVVVRADGAHAGHPGRRALAIRGYAPVAPGREAEQVIAFGTARRPSYAWSFDRGDGLANVGYGELLPSPGRPGGPTRAHLLGELERLLPGASRGGDRWRAHHLPLSGRRWRPPDGPVLAVGDAAGLVNPLTGEGIFYAVATGLLAGEAAARAVGNGRPGDAGRRYRRASRGVLLPHLRHTDLAARLVGRERVLSAGLAASARDQGAFDDLVELGLAGGLLTRRLAGGMARALVPVGVGRTG